MTQASVALLFRLDDGCIAKTLQSDAQVVGFREMEGGYWFELADPALVEDELPSFLARQRRGPGAEPVIDLTSNFRAGRDAATLRESVMRRQQALLTRVVEMCAGREPHFGLAEVCGKGEENTLCVHGSLTHGGRR